MDDLVLRGGLVIDGTGAEPRTTDVAVSGGRIVAIGDDLGSAEREIDVRGLLVTPGFIDLDTGTTPASPGTPTCDRRRSTA